MDISNIVSIIKTVNREIQSVGTGFLVKNLSFIITCYHVAVNAGCCNIGEKLGFMFEEKEQAFSAELEYFDKAIDVAILSIKQFQTMGYNLSCNGKEGDTFDTLGFPKGSLTGKIAHPSFERISPRGLMELKNSNDICQGFSGAPLLDENGSVAGVIRICPECIRREGSLLNYASAIPIETIKEKFSDILYSTRQNTNYDTVDFANTETTCQDSFSYGKDEINPDENIFLSDKAEQVIAPTQKEPNVSFVMGATAAKRTVTCFKSQDINNVAKETFSDLVKIWMDKTETNGLSCLTPDPQNIDFVIDLPSMRSGMSSIQTFWQIVSTSHEQEKRWHPEFGTECFHINLSNKTISCLREISQLYKHFYLAFAHTTSDAEPYELYKKAPQERFEWYCVDLSQQLENDVQEDYIVVPDFNKLNLSTFSLLWSSLWVEKFYHPIYSPAIIDVPNLMDVIRITHPYKNEAFAEFEDWNSVSQKLLVCERELGKTEYAKLSLPLGIGYSLEVIKKKLYNTSSKLNTIQNYCPESLYGMVNLWLFSRSYRSFMSVSGKVVNVENCNNNLRILPLPDDPKNISGIVKACLWHVVLLYSSLNVKVNIVYRPSNDAGVDHSYYGGGIGYFPWMSLSDDGVTWMMENSSDVTNSEHRDFINAHMNNIFIDPYHNNLSEIANAFNLHTDDIRTAPACPMQLFPKESRFIEYPQFIFGNSAIRSLNLIKLKLS